MNELELADIRRSVKDWPHGDSITCANAEALIAHIDTQDGRIRGLRSAETDLCNRITTLEARLAKAENAILRAHTRGSMGHFMLCYQSLDAHVAAEVEATS